MYKAMQDMIAIGRDNIFSALGVPSSRSEQQHPTTLGALI
jgi:hypothetical protein